MLEGYSRNTKYAVKVRYTHEGKEYVESRGYLIDYNLKEIVYWLRSTLDNIIDKGYCLLRVDVEVITVSRTEKLAQNTCGHFSHEPRGQKLHVHYCESESNLTQRCGYVSADDSESCPWYKRREL